MKVPDLVGDKGDDMATKKKSKKAKGKKSC